MSRRVVQFAMLGPLEVRRDDGSVVTLGGPRQRAVVARLLLAAGRVVAADRLIEDVWDGRPPPTANKALQKYVSELRKALVAPVLRTTPAGYVLDVDDGAVDARRFEQLVDARRYEEALGLWHGDVLSDLGDAAFAVPERARLDELRLFAQEARFDGQLADGRHAELVAELAELAENHRLRERLTAQLMLALYRSGRQVEALRAFDRHRRQLAEDVGVEPAIELRELEGAILRHDRALDLERREAGDLNEPQRPRELPLPLTSFVGRTAEMAGGDGQLRNHRLVTLTGPGGVGKTRLGLGDRGAVAERFPGGVRLIDLGSVGAAELVVGAVARGFAVDPRHAPDETTALLAALAHRPPSLIVLDNCEHVVKASGQLVVSVLRSCPDVRVLATSRRPLGVDGEYVRPVAPLSQVDAVSLFVDRARLAGAEPADVPEIVNICRRMDGLPLAIELAASQLRVMGTAEIADRLGDQLHFHRGVPDPSPRQGSLGDMVRWSYDLLPPATQQVLPASACSPHHSRWRRPRPWIRRSNPTGRGAWSRHDARRPLPARARAGPDRGDPVSASSSTSHIALERLEESGGGRSDARRAHADFYRRLAEEAAGHLIGPDEVLWRSSLEVDEANFDIAVVWASDHDPTMALRLAVALWPYWSLRWNERRAVAYLRELLDRPDLDVPDDLLAWALAAAGDLASNPGDARRAVRMVDRRRRRVFRRLGDEHGLSLALLALGSALANRGALDDAEAALVEALDIARRRDDNHLAARAFDRTFFVAVRRGDHELAAEISRSEIDAWVTLGSARGEATALRRRAVAVLRLGQLDEAETLCCRALEIWDQCDDVPASIAHVITTLADIARLRGEHAEAISLYDKALGDLQAVGDQRCTASTYKNLATIAAASGENDSAAELFQGSVRLRHDLGDEAGLAECFEGLAGVDVARSRFDDAAMLLAAAAALRGRTGSEASAGEIEVTTRLLRDARAALGELSFDEAYARGAHRSVGDAVEHALSVG